jgi:hypothetical protein
MRENEWKTKGVSLVFLELGTSLCGHGNWDISIRFTKRLGYDMVVQVKTHQNAM